LIVSILSLECGAIAMMTSHRLAAALLVGWAGLHVGIFIFSGICFWKWLVVDLTVATVLISMSRREIQWLFHGARPWVAILLNRQRGFERWVYAFFRNMTKHQRSGRQGTTGFPQHIWTTALANDYPFHLELVAVELFRTSSWCEERMEKISEVAVILRHCGERTTDFASDVLEQVLWRMAARLNICRFLMQTVR